MKPNKKQTILFVLFLVVFVVVLYGFCYFKYQFNLFGKCSDDSFQNFTSPNGLHTAQLFRRDCGATTDFTGHVTLDGKEIFKMNHFYRDINSRHESIRIEWFDNGKELLVSYAYNNSPDDIWTSGTEYNGVKIEYFYWPCIGPIEKIPEGQCLE